jgi:hypothetical protein
MLQDGLQNDGFLEVGIENTSGWNFKDLEGMLGNSKALKRNNRESKGILIDPLMAPRFSECQDSVLVFFPHCTKGDVGFGSNFAARMASRQPNLPKKGESTCMDDRTARMRLRRALNWVAFIHPDWAGLLIPKL